MEIVVKAGDLDEAIRKLKKISQPILAELKMKAYAMSRAEKRRMKDSKASLKRAKTAGKLLRRESAK